MIEVREVEETRGSQIEKEVEGGRRERAPTACAKGRQPLRTSTVNMVTKPYYSLQNCQFSEFYFRAKSKYTRVHSNHARDLFSPTEQPRGTIPLVVVKSCANAVPTEALVAS